MIRPATLAHASFILANMRPADRVEVMCQVPPATKTYEIAYGLVMGAGEAWIAYHKDQPVMVFGVAPMNVAALSVWAIGTRHAWRVIPEITRFFLEELIPRQIANGYHTMEARSYHAHVKAHRWMKHAGAVADGSLHAWGRDGELFQLFRWTSVSFPAIRARHGYSDTTQ